VQDSQTFSIHDAAKLACIALCCWSMNVLATPISDPTGDFGSLFLGPNVGGLDVVSAEVTLFGQSNFVFSATMDDNISTAPSGSVYVFGLNRGKGAALFAGALPAGFGTSVLFDSVVALFADGSGGLFADIIDATGGFNTVVTPFGPSNVQISGATITGSLLASLIPTRGFAPSDYTWNLWPRTGLGGTAADQISDFAPDNSNVLVTSVPEPGTLSLLVAGLLALGFTRRRAAA